MEEREYNYEDIIKEIHDEMISAIKKKMKKMNISQHKLALEINRRQTVVSNIFSGKSSPKMETLILMMDALGLTIVATEKE